MGGVDDLGALDALQVDRGGAEVGVAQLTLDDVEGDALVGQLDGVTRRSGCGAAARVERRSTTAAPRDGPSMVQNGGPTFISV